MRASRYIRFSGLLQGAGWMTPAYVGLDQHGIITYLASLPPKDVATESVLGYALPGFQNAHSHAFQYAIAGLTETHPTNIVDDFWSWREAMYLCAMSIDPDQLEAIAAMLYIEMLRNGYTHVAEFHYLHHDGKGKRYENLSELGERLLLAAGAAGIRITLLPVLYQKGGFGKEPDKKQQRFLSQSADEYFKLLQESGKAVARYPFAALGWGVHSLRAVDPGTVKTAFRDGPADLPFHIHVAEQEKEVNDCLAFCGKRPAQWLIDNLPVNERFHLVHATHLDDQELNAIATSGANVVLCPSTEGNLGDGIFRMREYSNRKGRWSIGSDSHIGLNPLEEFRMIDYRQRLIAHQRDTFDGNGAKYMVNESVRTGRTAMGRRTTEHFEIGQPFDAVVYSHPSLTATDAESLLPSIVYHQDRSAILGTIVAGKWLVRDQQHVVQQKITADYLQAARRLRHEAC